MKERGVFKIVKQEPGVKNLDKRPRPKYKEANCTFLKKTHMYLKGDQQIPGINFKESDPCICVLKTLDGISSAN